MPDQPISALGGGAPYALEGKVVSMNQARDVFERGVVYVDGKRIAAVQDTGWPPPAGFEETPRIRTSGTIFPGMIELHNHLS